MMNEESGDKKHGKIKSDKNVKLKKATETTMNWKTEDKKPKKKTETCTEDKKPKKKTETCVGPKVVRFVGATCSTEKQDEANPTASKTEMNMDKLCNDYCKLRLCLKDGTLRKPFIIKKNEIHIGSEGACDIFIKDPPGPGRKHCAITIDQTGKAFVDALSKNGQTILNGEVLQSKKSLNDDDILTIAKKTFIFNYERDSKFSKRADPSTFHAGPSTSKLDKGKATNKKATKKGKSGRKIKKASRNFESKINPERMARFEKLFETSIESSDDSIDYLFETEDESNLRNSFTKLEWSEGILKKLLCLGRPVSEGTESDQSGQKQKETISFEEYPFLESPDEDEEQEDISPPPFERDSEHEYDNDFDAELLSEQLGFPDINSDFESLTSFYRNKHSMEKVNNILNSLSAVYKETREREKRVLLKAQELKNNSGCIQSREIIQEILNSFMYKKEILHRQNDGQYVKPLKLISAIKDTTMKISIVLGEIERRNKVASLKSGN